MSNNCICSLKNNKFCLPKIDYNNLYKDENGRYNDFRLCVEIPIKIKWNNFEYTSIPSFERPRIAGVKNVNEIKDGFLILYALFKLYLKKC